STERRSDTYRYTPSNTGKKNDNDWISWVIIGLLFVSGWGWWIGLILLINKLKDDKRRPMQRSYTTTRTTTTTTTTTTSQTERTSGVRKTPQRTVTRETTSRVTNAAQRVTRSPRDTNKSSKVLQIVGIVMMALFGIGFASEIGNIFNGGINWSDLFSTVGFLAGGATMFFAGRKMQSRRNRIDRYKAFMGERDYVKIEELVMITGKKLSVVQKDVDYMLQKNMLGTGAFYDAGHGILFRSADAYQRYLQERTKKENLTPKEATEGYSGALRAIRDANDRIPDPVFSEKLDHMEEIAGKIFREVEAHPEKQKQASTFFDYYLPTTLKLLSTYTEFEEAGIEGENLHQAKRRIESIMDTLLENFEKQLDELYRSEAMDVDADIRVMESMLDRDLSSVERDFGIGGPNGSVATQRQEEIM
ncbi:MAG: 5-bromo-4-chloroindolyl phosphate hydrolysis family protein, partial [Oscillospiraceae bacterium]|nr:5-bromo-4-chloroindolyl phosphate hydrolysis family protein [Oscillospiraceae bacterium]